MPIDPVSRQPKGFATVTYVVPENAVKAFTELDGTAFCGRMMHLLPAKTEKLDEDNDDGTCPCLTFIYLELYYKHRDVIQEIDNYSSDG